ncbi:YhgN family NAAT transporter [Sodalis-like secondary symbiont of Drepanosiphum platanoidis]|uniref:YhgN family NAAT transporter n=1 Tax=Sodalis-like secondary symbiont of Drepanosiphum platanoidis TaxID=2994493 RepID=UPI003463A056
MKKIISDIIFLLLIIDPLGNLPIFINILKNINYKRRFFIIIREMIFSLFIMFIFLFFGEKILFFLNLKNYVVSISGGIILFLIALKMIFLENKDKSIIKKNNEPFLVPIAIPLISGPSILSSLIIFSHNYSNNIKYVIFILFISWLIALIILLISNYLIKFLGKQGMIAIERIMGLILIMISIQMILNGIKSYLN